jgi:hypothetical protein
MERPLLLVVLLIISITLKSQNSEAPKQLTKTYLLRNGNVVKQPGMILTKHDVLIKEGRIVEVGKNIKQPFDALTISVDSMYVYAGFIDGYSNTGIAKPEQKDAPKADDPGFPSNDLAGVTPQITSIETFKSSDKSVGDMRSAGFTISQVAPRGRMLPGASNVLLLGSGNADKLLIKAGSSQNFQFVTARGVFPSTTIGVMAKLRDVYKNAFITGSHIDKYKLNPSGLSRPDYDASAMAMYPVTQKAQKLSVVSPYTKDIHKSLTLMKELGFDMVLADVKQGWHYADEIKSNKIGLWLSMELPEENKVANKDSTSQQKVKKDSIEAQKSIKEVDKNQDAFDAKKLESYKQYVGQAAYFEKKGIPFGFSMLNAKPEELKKNLMLMISEGLTENTALAALTTHPAMMMGLSSIVGTVESGKLANLVISDKPFFNEKSKIRYVFVDGQKYEYNDMPKKSEDKTPNGESQQSLTGKWSYSSSILGETETGKFVISKSGESYKIVAISDSNPEELEGKDVNIKANNVTFYMMINLGQLTRTDFDLTFESKSFKGTITIPQLGSFPITGEMIDPNN